MEGLLGPKLIQEGKEVDCAAAIGKAEIVCLYFSAHWCPPCRGFTPVLAQFYTEAVKKYPIQIVFVSFDKNDAQFNEYFKTMPWVAIPFANEAKRENLSTQFNCSGIPYLVVLNKSGKEITSNGRGDVTTKGVEAAKMWLDQK